MHTYLPLLKRLWGLLKPFHTDFYLQLLGTVLIQAIQIAQIFFIAKVLDSIINSHISSAFAFVLGAFLLNELRIGINFLVERHAQNKLQFAIQQYLEEFSFKKIFTLNIAQYIEDHSAIKEQVINRGENAIENVITTLVLTILPVVTQVLFAIAAIAYFSPLVAFWTSISIILILIWENHFATSQRPLIRQNIDNWDTQRKVRTESFQHLSLIRTLSAESFYLKKYLGNRQSILDYQVGVFTRGVTHGSWRQAFIEFSRTVSVLIIIYLATVGAITVGAIYAAWAYIGQAYSQVSSVVRAVRQVPIRLAEVEKYLSVIDTGALFSESGKNYSLHGDIVISDLTFRYPQDNRPVLEKISVVIPSGKITAFVGASGSGKTTITKLLLRHYDYTEGTIKIGEHELHDFDTSYLRKHIGYVEQHVELFDNSIRENILVSVSEEAREHAEKQLEEVAQHARITEFYHRLGESRFDTVIGERGIKLSGGERQRVGIARAIIKEPDILIFDEATASLDTENETKVMEAIGDVSQGKTSIIIAHRLSTVRNADKIVVMDKGKIVGEGTHEQLMQGNEFYQILIAHQMV